LRAASHSFGSWKSDLTRHADAKPTMAPADGERRALRSFSAQYRVAAQLVRDALVEGELEWVRLVDPDAGRLDDVVIGRPGRVDAYQIKWSAFRGSVTFNQLVTPSKVSGKPYPAPFRLLADGWLALRTIHPDRFIRAHYLTHDSASSNDGLKRAGSDEPAHLQSFLRAAWPNRARWFDDDRSAFAQAWGPRIEEIADSSGLGGADLASFIRDCHLDLGYDLVEPDGTGRSRRGADIAELAHFLFDQVARSTGVVELSRSDVLRELKWTHRFELTFRHDFPVDEHLYRPVEETVAAIDRALVTHDRGYIALVGPPGAGKSTTLTQTLRYRSGIRLARYYAFVLDDIRRGRGEAETFLRDLCISLEAMLPGQRRGEHADTPEGLNDRLGELMGQMHADFVESGIRTVILVDGLDHIDREEDPKRSLIHELPHPASVPVGVLFVLGTQPIGLEGPAASLRPINAQLSQPGRTLTMAPLSRAGIRSIVDASVDPKLLGSSSHERLERLSGGHPLALAYLVKQVAACSDIDGVTALLDGSTLYAGEIESKYRTYWDTLRSEPEVRELLGLAARLRGSVDLSTLEALATMATLERFVATARHYFSQDTANTWRFFHNSFRQFVLDQTARNALGRPNSSISADLHRRLAAAGSAAPENSALAWERVHHLALAGDQMALRSIDHHALFRGQFLGGRPVWEIKDDIHLCMRAAAAQNEAFVVFSLMLIDEEIGDREDVLDEVDLAALELPLKAHEDLPRAFLEGSELLVEPALAMQWATKLAMSGEGVLANRLFDAAEPLGLLSGNERLNASCKDDDLDAWASCAWRFRSLEEVVSACRQVRVAPETADWAPPYDDEASADRMAQDRLFAKLALGLLRADEAGILSRLLDLIDPKTEARWLTLRLDVERVTRSIHGQASAEDGRAAMTRLFETTTPEMLSADQAVRLADLVCILGVETERAEPYLSRASEPLIVEQLSDSADDVVGPTEPLFRQARAMAARGRNMDPVTSVPDAARSHDTGRVLFQRILVMVAGVWGEALAGARLSSGEVTRRLGPAIRFYRRPWRESMRWLDWHYAQRAAPDLFDKILRAALAHGVDAYDAALAAFLADWEHKNPKLTGWSIDDRRAIAMAAFAIDGDQGRTTSILAGLDREIDISHDLHQRIDHFRSSAATWTKIEDRTRARASIDAMLATSFGVYRDRGDEVARWAARAADVIDRNLPNDEPEEAARLILSILPILHHAQRGGGTQDAVTTIMAAMSRRRPGAALACGLWLLENSAAQRANVLSGLLTGQIEGDDPDAVANALFAAARLLLPFDVSPDAGLAKAIRLVAVRPLSSHPRVAAAHDRVRTAVRTRVQNTGHFDELLGVAPTTLANERGTSSPSLNRPDGTVLGQQDVERLAGTPAALAAALVDAKAKGIDWRKVLDALPAQPDRAAFFRIGELLIDREPGAKILLHLTRKAASIGDFAIAKAATDAALAQSKHYGWVANYDGGSRLDAATCLVVSDPQKGRHRALELLAADYIDNRMSPHDLVGAIRPILSAVNEDADAGSIWSELRAHIEALAEARETTATPPSFHEAVAIAPSELPVRLLVCDMAHQANPVAWEARRGLIEIIRTGDPGGYARHGLELKMVGTLEETSAALQTILCLAWIEPALVGDLIERVKPLAWHEDAALRRIAQLTLEALDEPMPPSPPRSVLPAIYRLQLPPSPMPARSLRGEQPTPGEPLPDTTDPVDLSVLFHDALHMIEEETGYPFSNLTRRFGQLMHEVAPIETWSAEAENDVRRRLEAIQLKVNMRRPRSLVAHHAFGRLVAELCDAGELEWPPHALDGQLLTVDPLIDTADPEPRPDWLSVPTGKELGSYPREQWVAAVSDALAGPLTVTGGSVIVAELTRTVSLDGQPVEESRARRIAHPDFTFRDRMPDMASFGRDFDNIASEYPMLYGKPRHMTASVAGGLKFSDADFLALNPVLGFHLDWTVSLDGLFRWVDRTGATMAETLHWHQGNTWLHDRAGMDECASEGWLVLASPTGWRQMRSAIDHFVVHLAIGRRVGEHDGDDEMIAVHRAIEQLSL
jgi:hypothetical protein